MIWSFSMRNLTEFVFPKVLVRNSYYLLVLQTHKSLPNPNQNLRKTKLCELTHRKTSNQDFLPLESFWKYFTLPKN